MSSSRASRPQRVCETDQAPSLANGPSKSMFHRQGDETGKISGGVPLSAYQDLLECPPTSANDTFHGVDPYARLNPESKDYVQELLSIKTDPKECIHDLPLAYWKSRTPSEYWMMRLHAEYAFCLDTERALNLDPRHALLGKIISSYWRYSLTTPSWSEIADAYTGIASFDLGLENFEARLDHTHERDMKGPGFHECVYLDGALAFHIHHASKRVMTISFSFAKGRRILIQQIQLASKRGNRWLFRFPPHRLEFFLERFAAAFPQHSIHVTHEDDLCEAISSLYQKILETREKHVQFYETSPHKSEDDIAAARGKVVEQKAKIVAFNTDKPRLKAFYANTGRFQAIDTCEFRSIRYRRVILPQIS